MTTETETLDETFTVEMAVDTKPGEWWPLEPHNGEADHEDREAALRVMRDNRATLKPGFVLRVVDAGGAVVAGPVYSGDAGEE